MATVWNVLQTERELVNGGITVCHWSAVDSETVGSGENAVVYEATNVGSCTLTPDSTASDFVAYTDVTEASAIAWVKASLGADEVSNIESSLAAQITASKTPTSAFGVPW
ncbi:MAG TPA: hypothetical protein DCW83_13080 [Saprospirales bacterium]|jgi:hypothetical protein|nr:hypothetical protein [Saprospirales bacterium]